MAEIGGTFVIAEAGVNHNGSLDLALRLVEVAAEAKADAVKFQTFRADRLASAAAPKAEYQSDHTGGGTQLSMLRQLELSDDDHRAVVRHCCELGIEFMSTPFDAGSAEFLVELGMRRIKVPSGELTNKPFIEHLAGLGKSLVVSTGMATLEEVKEALSWIKAVHDRRLLTTPVTLLHCTSNYPAAPDDVNLRAMATLASETGFPVGYSDHTNGIAVATAAVALGATVIEKHFTLDRNLPGPDHQASLEKAELVAMVDAIRVVERCLGNGQKEPRATEWAMRDIARRSLTLVKEMKTGDHLQAGDIEILRPGNGIAPKFVKEIMGRRLARDLPMGTTLQWSDLRE
jgi:N,N'-diacetyllegionaminate synthase